MIKIDEVQIVYSENSNLKVSARIQEETISKLTMTNAEIEAEKNSQI